MRSSLSILCVILVSFTAGCSSKSGDDTAVAAVRTEMQARVDSLERIIAELRDTPERRLLDANALQSAGRTDAAIAAFRSLAERYPESEEAAEGRAVLARIEQERAANLQEAERRQRLRFLALPVERSVDVGDVEATVRGVSIRNQWIFDRYGDRWHYRDARRGSKFVVAELTLSADQNAHNPALPPVVVYRAQDSLLQRVGIAEYHFYAWQDYGSYLGNYSDYGNDFAHTRSIRFSAGLEIEDGDAGQALYVLLGKSGCVSRVYKEYGNPEVYYSEQTCSPPQSLTVDQVAQGFYVIHRVNAG